MPLNKIRKNSCINHIFLPKFWAQIVVAAYIRDKLLSAAVNWLVFTRNNIKAVFNRSLHRSLHHAIRENSQGKLPTVPLPFISRTCTACLAMWLLRSCLATSFLRSMAYICIYILRCLPRKEVNSFTCLAQTSLCK